MGDKMTDSEFNTNVETLIKALELDSHQFLEVKKTLVRLYGTTMYKQFLSKAMMYIRLKYFRGTVPIERAVEVKSKVKEYFGDEANPLYI